MLRRNLNNGKKNVDGKKNAIVALSDLRRGRGWGGGGVRGTPLYKSYRYVPPRPVGFLALLV